MRDKLYIDTKIGRISFPINDSDKSVTINRSFTNAVSKLSSNDIRLLSFQFKLIDKELTGNTFSINLKRKFEYLVFCLKTKLKG